MNKALYAQGNNTLVSTQQIRPSGAFARKDLVESRMHSGEYRFAIDRITANMGCTDIRDLFKLLPEIFDSVVKIEMEIDKTDSEPLRIGAVVDPERVYFTTSSNLGDPLQTTSVPLILKDTQTTREIGKLHILSLKPLSLNQENVDDHDETEQAISIFSSLVARTIDAKLDGLTALPLRKYFDRTLEETAALYLSEGRNFSLILVDLDHFKRVNDEFGHPRGDSVLSETAMILHNSIRGRSECPDRVFRSGGEEFAIILPEVPREEATKIAQRLRLSIKANDFGISRPVTCSIGVADARELSGSENLAKELYALADKRLYEAKEGGRDSVVSMMAVK